MLGSKSRPPSPLIGQRLSARLTSSSLSADGTGLNLNGSDGETSLTSGSIGIYISAYSSSLLNFTEAYYDLEMINGREVTRLLEGKVRLSKNVTR